MMAGPSIFIIVFMAFGSLAPQVLDMPPADLATLVEPKAVLAQSGHATDEASLIALLSKDAPEAVGPNEARLAKAVADLGAADGKVRIAARKMLADAGSLALPVLQKAVKASDPEVRTVVAELIADVNAKQVAAAVQKQSAYVKQLMAIRALEKMKSKKALPALAALKDSTEVTLRDAAKRAQARINGEKLPGPDMKKVLAAMAASVPEDTGFVITWDLGSKRGDLTIADYFDLVINTVKKQMGKNGGQLQPMIQAMEQEKATMIAEGRKGVTEALSNLGNIRVDAISVMFSGDFLAVDDSGYIAIVCKGAYDPDRLLAWIKEEDGDLEKQKVGGLAVWHDDEMALCTVDRNTLVFAFSEDDVVGRISAILARVQAKGKPAHPPSIQAGFDLITNGKTRIAASGAFTKAQSDRIIAMVAEGRAELLKQQEQMANAGGMGMMGAAMMGPMLQMQEQSLNLMGGIAKTKQISTWVNLDGTFETEFQCIDKKTAKAIQETMAALDTSYQLMMGAMLQMQGKALPEAGAGDGKVNLWDVVQKGTTVTVKLNLNAFNTLYGGMMMGM